MAKSWSEVEQSVEFKSLNPAQQSQAKTQYFDTVVTAKPEFAALDTPKKYAARQQFLGAAPQQAGGQPDVEQFLGTMKQIMQASVQQRYQQQEQAQQQQIQAAQQQQIQEEIKKIQDEDPRTWASSRFKKEFPKPRTPEEQVFYDMLLEDKVAKEAEIRKKIEGSQRAALGLVSPAVAAAQSAGGAGLPLGQKLGEEYAQAREKFVTKVGEKLPGGAAQDIPFNMTAPNPMAPSIPAVALPLGQMTPRRAVGETAAMGLEEAATAAFGLVAQGGLAAVRGLARTAPLYKELPNIVREGVMRGVKPAVGSIKNMAGFDKYLDEATRAVSAIYDNRQNLGLVDEAGEPIERLPESLKEFGDSIGATKEKVFKQYDALAQQAGEAGAVVDLKSIAEDILASLSESRKVLKTVAPEALAYAEKRALALKRTGQFTSTEAQDAVKVLNRSLESFYKNPTYDTASKAVVDAGIANAMRKALDTAVERMTGSQYQVLRNIYKSLKTIEKDVARRTIVEARKGGKGLIDFSDIFSGAEIVRGIIRLDPGSVAAGATAKGIASFYKRINSPDRAIKMMFRKYDRAWQAAKAGGKAAPQGPSVTEPIKAVSKPADNSRYMPKEAAKSTNPKGSGGSKPTPKKPFLNERGSALTSGNKPTAPTFFSTAEKLIEQKMPNSATPEQVRGILRSGGVKAEEYAWLDIDGFLKDKTKVSKQEVAEYIRSNNVQVEEVVKGGPSEPDFESDKKIYEASERNLNELVELNKKAKTPALQERIDAIGRVMNQLDSKYGGDIYNPTETPTKFHSYQLPGGENYRELLLTLPENVGSPVEYEARLIKGKAWTIFKKGDDFPLASGFDSKADAEKAIRDNYKKHSVENFRSSHFDEPNVLAHVRFNDRVDADGKKVLFIEEIQSDWHQKGRKGGYRIEGDKKLASEALSAMEAIEKKHGFMMDKWSPEVQAEYNKWASQLDQASTKDPNGVPNAPFKKTWHELALKRMLRYASENDYDKIAWTTGEQQAARYDLSKQVGQIGARKIGEHYILNIDGPNGGQVFFKRDMTLQQVEETIGKDIAKKIAEQPDGERVNYEGEDLKVGGEGMKGFYDQMLPSFLNKYGKKWGAQTGKTTIRSAEKKVIKGKEYEGRADLVVPSIDITPTMKNSVLSEGQPLFSGPLPWAVGASAAGLTAAGIAEAKDVKIDRAKMEEVESSNNQKAVSPKGAVGVRQVTKPALTDFNKAKPEKKYTMGDMRASADKNREVSDWYIDVQIPRLLKAAGFEVTKENVLRAYNQGVGSMRNGKYPKETREYVKKQLKES